MLSNFSTNEINQKFLGSFGKPKYPWKIQRSLENPTIFGNFQKIRPLNIFLNGIVCIQPFRLQTLNGFYQKP